MKRMLRWRFRRCIASLLMFAMTVPLGEGLVARMFTPAAQAAAARQQSVVVFDFANKSNYGGEAFGHAFTRQVRLAMEQSPTFDPVDYSAQPPRGASIERALAEKELTEQDLVSTPDPATALKITRVLGAECAVLGEVQEDGYEYNAEQKRVVVRVLAYLYSAASDTPINSVSVTGEAQGDLGQGALTERAMAKAAAELEARLANREVKSEGEQKAPRAKKLWPYVAGVAVVAIVAASLFGGKESKGPAAPAALSVTATRDGVRLAWAPIGGAEAYRIYRAAVSGVSAQGGGVMYQQVAEVAGGQVQYDDKPPAAPNVRYLYRVAAVSGGKEGTPVQAERALAPGEPSQVRDLQATVNQRTIQLSWAANPEDFVSLYRIYRSTQMSAGYTRIAEQSSSVRTYADSGLGGGVTYFYKVSAVGQSGVESDWQSMTAVARSTDLRPAAPTGVLATATEGQRRIVISWRASTEPDLKYYEVHRGSRMHRTGGSGVPMDIFSKFPRQAGGRSGSWTKYIGNIPPTTTSVQDDNVDFNTTYYYVVRAVSAHGESEFSEEVSATPNKAPSAVQNVRAQAGDGRVTITWGAPAEPDIAGYNVHRQVLNQPTTRTKLNDQPVTVLQYVDQTVVNDTTYQYFVTAIDTAQLEGPLSVPAEATPTAPPETPRNVSATAGSGRVTVMWDRNSEANLLEYRVYRSDSPTLTPMPQAVVPATASDPAAILYADTPAENGVTYYYQVTAVNKSGVESERSQKVSATPDVPPAAPENVQVVAGDKSATITWNPVTRLAPPDNREIIVTGRTLRSYRIYRTIAHTGVRTLVEDVPLTALAGQPKYEDRRAPTGVGLRYSVTATMLDANNGVLESDEGKPVSDEGTVDQTPVIVVRRLPAPTNLQGVPDDNKVVLSWNPVVDPTALGYVLYGAMQQGGPFKRLFAPIGTDGKPVIPAATTTFTVDQAVWNKLRNDTRFWFKVAAVDKLGVEGNLSTDVMVVPNPPPPTPLDLQVTNQGTGGPLDMAIQLTWKAPTPAPGSSPIVGYRVYRAVSANGPFQLITPQPVPASLTPSFSDQFTDGLVSLPEAAGQEFYYQVVSLVEFPTAGFAESRPTPAAGPVKLINIPPGKVQNLVAAGASGVVTLKWDAVKDASGNVVRDLVRYTISRREKGDDAGLTEQLFWVEPDVLQYFDTEVTPGLTYVYRVRAVDFVSEGAWSDEKEATP